LTILFCSSTSSAMEASAAKNVLNYKISGTAKGFSERANLYLEMISCFRCDGHVIDFATIVNGSFEFAGTLKNDSVKLKIRTQDSNEFKIFWLEKPFLNINLEKGKFESTLISGSKLQFQQDELTASLFLIDKEKSDLEKRFKLPDSEKYTLSSRIKALERNKYDKIVSFIKTHRTSMISAAIMDEYGTYLSSYDFYLVRKNMLDLYSSMSDHVRNSTFGQEIMYNFIVSTNKVKIGDHYIDFQQQDQHGNIIKLSDVRADFILLEFWGSACLPCRTDNPELVRIYKDYKNRGFEIFAVSLDKNKEHWVNAIKEDNLTWKHGSDLRGLKNDAVEKYGVLAIPFNFLIDKKGVIVDRDLKVGELREKLEHLFR
jgi:peroxiredoxin